VLHRTQQSVMAAGGSQVPVVGEVRRCLIPETSVNGHGKLVLHSLTDVEPVLIDHGPTY